MFKITNSEALWNQLFAAGSGEFIGKPAIHGFNGHQWVHIDQNGEASPVDINRRLFVDKLKLRYRDLSTVDPTLPLPVPSVILVRHRAIALNLDVGGAICLIICENQAYVLSVPKATDPSITALPTLDHPFIRRLCHYLKKNGIKEREEGSGECDGDPSMSYDTDMPYELRALEVALSAAIGILSRDITDLEEWGYPCVDSLLKSVDRGTLERIRKLKNSIDKLKTKVQRIMTELSDLLDDDEDMGDLYLARRSEAYNWPPLPQRPWEESGGYYPDECASLSSLTPSPYFSEDKSEHENSPREKRKKTKMQRRATSSSVSRLLSAARDRRKTRGEFNPKFELGVADEASHTAHGQQPLQNNSTESHKSSESFDSASHSRDQALERALVKEADVLVTSADVSFGRDHGTSLPPPNHQRRRRKSTSEDENGTDNNSNHSHSFDYFVEKERRPVNPHDIEEAEDLLETMFERADVLFQRLNLLDESVDTEDFLELDLDQKRNQLFALNLVVATFSMSFGFAAALSGIFGMNLYNASAEATPWVLIVVLSGMLVGCVLLLTVVFFYVRKRKLMFIPNIH